MSEFKVGDYVQVVEMRGEGAEDYHERRADYLGMVGRITDIAGADYPYSVEFGGEVSYHWFNADELTAIAPATEPTAAAQGEGSDDDDDEPLELSVHRFIPGLWRVTHFDGVTSMELVAEDADASGYTELIDMLHGSIKGLERENARLANEYDRGWKGATESMLSIIERTLENPAGDKLTHIETLLKHFRIDYQKAASAQQAANAEGGA